MLGKLPGVEKISSLADDHHVCEDDQHGNRPKENVGVEFRIAAQVHEEGSYKGSFPQGKEDEESVSQATRDFQGWGRQENFDARDCCQNDEDDRVNQVRMTFMGCF